MKFITLVAAIIASIPTALAALTVNSPASVVECEPTQFAWSGGVAPYYLTLVPAGQPSASPIKQFPTQNGNEYTWNVDLASGTSFSIALKDSTGSVAYSSIITIQAGSSTSCVNTTVQETGGSGSSVAATGGSAGSTAAGSTATSAGSSPAQTSGGSSGAATTSASAASASSSSSSNTSGAGRVSMSSAFGVAGLMGLVGAALF